MQINDKMKQGFTLSQADTRINDTDYRNLLSGSKLADEDITPLETKGVKLHFSFMHAQTDGEFGFNHIFAAPEESKCLFDTLKFLSRKSINELYKDSVLQEVGRKRHELHFHFHNTFSPTLSKLIKTQFNTDIITTPPIYHISTYFSQRYKEGESINKSPRVYFMAGEAGLMFPLYYDAKHEITKDATQLNKKTRSVTAKDAMHQLTKKYGKLK